MVAFLIINIFVRGKQYKYLKLEFSNKSKPLRQFVYETLMLFGFCPKYAGEKRVWLYSEKESLKYLRVVGSANQRLLKKIE